MTEALEKELEEMEKNEAQVADEGDEDEGSPEIVNDQDEDQGDDSADQPEKDVSEQDSEDEKLKKQEAYRERQRQKQEEMEREAELTKRVQTAPKGSQQEKIAKDELQELKEKIAKYDEIVQQQQFERLVQSAEQELVELEKDFKEAFTDYDDVVNNALELSKMRLMAQGNISESQAINYLNREKVLIADRAAAQGKDPVEAVYNEAKQIMSVFDAYAEKKGYKIEGGKPKTKLQAIREISKPNAMTGGTGKGAAASKLKFEELGDEDLDLIHETTIGELLGGR